MFAQYYTRACYYTQLHNIIHMFHSHRFLILICTSKIASSENTIVAVIVVARCNLIAYHINIGNFLIGNQSFFIQVWDLLRIAIVINWSNARENIIIEHSALSICSKPDSGHLNGHFLRNKINVLCRHPVYESIFFINIIIFIFY